MLKCRALWVFCSLVFIIVNHVHAQTPAPAEFEVVSIKRYTDIPNSASMRTLPDGGFIMEHMPIASIVRMAATTPVRDVVGLPDWAQREFYDLTAKAPVGSTRQQQPEMMQRMFADRMKLVAHVEQREQAVFALVPSNKDGRFGPQFARSNLDCSPRPPTGAPPPATFPSVEELQRRCGISFASDRMITGGATMDALALSLGKQQGRFVINHTGLDGFYAFTLRFTNLRNTSPMPDDPPDIFTALQEQLGLKLQPDKAEMPVLVIDHIERPTEN